jgi:Tol biopolymer transport system component
VLSKTGDIMRILWILLGFFLLFISCKKITDPIEIPPEENYVYLEGQQIPGTELFSPLGFYDLRSRPKVSPDGHFIVYEDQRFQLDPSIPPGLYILDLSTLEKRLLVEGFAYNADWSPDREWIAFNTYPQIHKIKVNGDSLTQLTTQGNNFFPDWSPDGQWIAYDRSLSDASGPGGIWVMKTDGSEKRWIGKGADPSWHPSSQKILGFIGDSLNYKRLVFYHINPDTLIGISEFKNKTIGVPEYSPDGSRILFGTPEGIWIADSEGEKAKRILPNHLSNPSYQGKISLFVGNPSWYPDGEHLIYEHFKITRYENPQPGFGPFMEGFYSFYKVNVDSALLISNLP